MHYFKHEQKQVHNNVNYHYYAKTKSKHCTIKHPDRQTHPSETFPGSIHLFKDKNNFNLCTFIGVIVVDEVRHTISGQLFHLLFVLVPHTLQQFAYLQNLQP